MPDRPAGQSEGEWDVRVCVKCGRLAGYEQNLSALPYCSHEFGAIRVAAVSPVSVEGEGEGWDFDKPERTASQAGLEAGVPASPSSPTGPGEDETERAAKAIEAEDRRSSSDLYPASYKLLARAALTAAREAS